MEIKQFEDKYLSHYSYAILSDGEVALVDPARNPRQYLEFAKEKNARITAVFETHPHADFVSSHLEISKETGATIYASSLLGAEYEHRGLEDGDLVKVGGMQFRVLLTPGHSPDSISLLAIDAHSKPVAVFTGDTLFIGDCGRPDLREKAGAITQAREELAKQMYHSLREKLMPLPNDVLVYPAHGAGSLCGKGLSAQNSSTMGAEKISNWSLQDMSEKEFVEQLLTDQPFIPRYFGFDVALNKKGAPAYEPSVSAVKIRKSEAGKVKDDIPVIDSRPQASFKKGHLRHAYNLMNESKFETWLGSIINPGEPFYLVAESEEVLKQLIARAASIGYEAQIEEALIGDAGNEKMEFFDSAELRDNPGKFTIVDVRNPSEVRQKKLFPASINIPLYELRERAAEIPKDKPVVVHCAAGYRSAAGSSILQAELDGDSDVQIFDLSDAIKTF